MRPKVIRRKHIRDLPKDIKYDIVHRYSRGEAVATMAAEYQVAPKALGDWISEIVKSLISMHETKSLIKTGSLLGNNIKSPKGINNEFLKLLSKPEDPLTDHEHLYVYLYVESGGDNKYALKASELDKGINEKDLGVVGELRGQYLRSKDNVAKALDEQRKIFIQNFGVTKENLQGHLIELITHLKGKNSPSQQLKAIELLMKSEDLLTNNVKISGVNPEEEMTKLFDMIKDDDDTYRPEDTSATEPLPEESD